MWPRTSAVAERLWSNPEDLVDWRDAMPRIRAHRERMVGRGVYAHALQPKFCLLYPDECPRPDVDVNGGMMRGKGKGQL